MEILYRGLGGSWLHKSNKEDSDKDYFYIFNDEHGNGRVVRRNKERGADHIYWGLGYFFRNLKNNAPLTIDTLHTKDYWASPYFKKLVLDRYTVFEDTAAMIEGYKQDYKFKLLNPTGGEIKSLSVSLYFQNMLMKYFDSGGLLIPTIEPGDVRYDAYQKIRHEAINWPVDQRLTFVQELHEQTLNHLENHAFVKRRDDAALVEAAKCFLTDKDYALYVGL